jgi:hypothetical protein
VACVRSGISGWVIGLLIRGRAGAERRAANAWSPWSPVLADGEAAAAFLFGHSRSAVAELFGNSRSQQLAGGKPSDVLATRLGMTLILLLALHLSPDFGRDRPALLSATALNAGLTGPQ